MNTRDLYRQTRRAALLGLAVTLALGVAKLLGGWLGHSDALLSDAVHSLGDALAAASVFGALLWAQRPADEEHPYGHARVEAVVGSSHRLSRPRPRAHLVAESASSGVLGQAE